jgi:hypothetical protein
MGEVETRWVSEETEREASPGGARRVRPTSLFTKLVEKLSKKSGRPQNEGVRSLRNGAKGLISLRYAGDFCARDTTERLFRQFLRVALLLYH